MSGWNVWGAARQRLSDALVDPDGTDAVEVLVDQGLLRWAICRIDELTAARDEYAASAVAEASKARKALENAASTKVDITS